MHRGQLFFLSSRTQYDRRRNEFEYNIHFDAERIIPWNSVGCWFYFV